MDKDKVIEVYRTARTDLIQAYIDDYSVRFHSWLASFFERRANSNKRKAEMHKLAADNIELYETTQYLNRCRTLVSKFRHRIDKKKPLSSRQVLRLTKLASTLALLALEYDEVIKDVQEVLTEIQDIMFLSLYFKEQSSKEL